MSLPRERSRPTGATRRRLALLLLALVVGLGVAACSSDDDGVAVPTSTTRRASTTSTSTDPAASQVVKRYDAFWDARLQANTDPVNPDSPALREYAVDPQLTQVLTETRQRKDQGLALRHPAGSLGEHRVKVVRVDGDTAELQDCVVDDDVVYRTQTGETVDDKVVTRNVTATMRRVEGVWRLAETTVVQKWEGVAGCARSSDF